MVTGVAAMWNLLRCLQYATIFLSYWAYRLIRMALSCVQVVTWRLNGFHDILQKSRDGLNYTKSAHVCKIIGKKKLFAMNIASTTDYITVHNNFVHPRYVLRSNVSLYCLSQHEAIFIEIGEKEHNSTIETAPFLYMEQFNRATKIISLPYCSFHRLTDDVGDPTNKIVWISSTGRCGSTLLGQVFTRISKTKLLSEPDAFINLGYLFKSNMISKEKYEHIFKSCVRIMCRSENSDGIICLKTRSCGAVHMQILGATFPTVKQIFLYRNFLPTISSFFGLLISEPLPKMVRVMTDSQFVSSMSPIFRKLLYFYFCYALDFEHSLVNVGSTSTAGFIAHSWSLCIKRCEEAIESGYPVLAILYEDLIKDPIGTCAIIFRKIGIEETYAETAIEAFTVDSQKDSVLGKQHINSKLDRVVSDKMKTETNVILMKYGLPGIGGRYNIQGSL